MFPSELDNIRSSVAEEAEIFRQDVKLDDAIFVGGGSWLSHVPVRTLAGIVAFTNAENCTDAADELYDQGGERGIPGLLIVLSAQNGSPSSGPSLPNPPRPGPSAPRPRRPRFGGLPTALSAPPPVRHPLGGKMSGQIATGPPMAQAVPEEDVPLIGKDEGLSAESPEDVEQPTQAPRNWPVITSQWSKQFSTAAQKGLRRAQAFFTRMLPDEKVVATPYADADSDGGVSRVMTSSASAALLMPGSAAPQVPGAEAVPESTDGEPVADISPPQAVPLPKIEPFVPPEPARGARARALILVAVIILFLVPTVVAVIYWGQGADKRAQAQQLTDAAQAQLIAAKEALSLGDKAGGRVKLTDAQGYLAKAIELDGGNDRRNELAANINTELQDVLHVVPLYALTQPLITFPAEARPHRVVVIDDDIYVLDTGRHEVLHYRFDPATGVVDNADGQAVLRQGDNVGGVIVGSMADITWLPLVPGYADRPSLLILDRNNNVFRYDQRVEGATLLRLGGEAEWHSASQIRVYLGRIYIADEGAGQVYKYSLGQLDSPPQPWFNAQTPVKLGGIISMEIDGDIWFLFGSDQAQILRYRGGEQVPFSLENSVGLTDQPMDMYVTRKDKSLIYLVDGAEDRILVFDKSGAYHNQLKAPEGQLLHGLTSLYIDEVSGTMYILTQTALFKHPLPE